MTRGAPQSTLSMPRRRARIVTMRWDLRPLGGTTPNLRGALKLLVVSRHDHGEDRTKLSETLLSTARFHPTFQEPIDRAFRRQFLNVGGCLAWWGFCYYVAARAEGKQGEPLRESRWSEKKLGELIRFRLRPMRVSAKRLFGRAQILDLARVHESDPFVVRLWQPSREGIPGARALVLFVARR